jgi:2-keto-4-pentenoate hydratase
MTDTSAPVAEAALAASLRTALKTGRPISPIREQVGEDLEAAYRIQSLLLADLERNSPRVGRKVGLTSPAVQKQLGVDQPDFGVLLENMRVAHEGALDVSTLIAPKAEAEVAFVLKADILDAARDAVVEAIDYATAAIEIVDSRILNWDISIVDTVADNASSSAFVLGNRRLGLDEFDPVTVQMTMTVNGSEVSRGNGAACLGDPLNALVWVAETALRVGEPLRAGEIILSGALGPMAPLHPGDAVAARIGRLGTVEFTAEGTKLA